MGTVELRELCERLLKTLDLQVQQHLVSCGCHDEDEVPCDGIDDAVTLVSEAKKKLGMKE